MRKKLDSLLYDIDFDDTEKKIVLSFFVLIIAATIIAPSTALLVNDKTNKDINATFKSVPSEVKSVTFEKSKHSSIFESQSYKLTTKFKEKQEINYINIFYGDYGIKRETNTKTENFEQVYYGRELIVDERFPPKGYFRVQIGTQSERIEYFMKLEIKEES